MPYILLLFVAMPIIEIAVLLRVGSALGWLPTLAVVIVTAILGSAMLRQQGLATMATARQRLDAGEMPAQQLLEGMLLLIGGVFLLTPGFVTDAFGFACLVPWTRRWLSAKIAARSTISFGGIAGAGGVSGAGIPGQGGSKGQTVGSGSTSGARQADAVTEPLDGYAGGKPQPDSAPSAQSGDIVDAEFRRVDE